MWLREENENWRAFATEEGCVQGCVMGPLVFGFVTIALYEKVQKELKNKENSLFKAWYFSVRFVAPTLVGLVFLYFFI